MILKLYIKSLQYCSNTFDYLSTYGNHKADCCSISNCGESKPSIRNFFESKNNIFTAVAQTTYTSDMSSAFIVSRLRGRTDGPPEEGWSIVISMVRDSDLNDTHETCVTLKVCKLQTHNLATSVDNMTIDEPRSQTI